MKLYFVTHDGRSPKIVKELYENNGLYYGFEYEKDKKKFLKIGVVCEEATHVIVKQHNILIHLDQAKDGIWYHAQQTWDDGLYGGKTEGIFGFNVGGDFYIQAWNENTLLGEAHVAIIPRVFTLSEYRSMQQEVVQLIESFSIDTAKLKVNEAIYLKRIQRHLYPLNKLDYLVGEFTALLDEIVEQPGFKLTQESIKKHRQNIKRWTSQLILQESVTQKEYLTMQQTTQSARIAEHQMISYMLNQMLQRMDQEMEKEGEYIEWLKQDAEKLKMTISNAGNNQYSMFVRLKEQIAEDLETLDERETMYKRLKMQIAAYTELDLFQVEAIPVEETHLFKMDVKYKTIFELYNNFETMLNEQLQNLQPFIKSLLKSPSLYEIWIFLKLVEQFKKWGFSSLQFIEWIKNKYSDAEKLIGFDEIFELSEVPFRVRLMFNKYLPNVNLQPDYIIGIQNNGSSSWQWHTADAKYKIYNESSVKELIRDINHSAVRYYNNIYFNEETVKSSVIIHPNAGVSHWNMRQNGQASHTISHFFVKPLDTSMLRVYFKRLLHHYGKFEHICPTCNTRGNIIRTKKYTDNTILTYECDNCSEVWVSSHCWSSKCKKETGSLYKYAIDNYNYQVQQQWNVHCPNCHADANGLYEQGSDLLHETYRYLRPKPQHVKTWETKVERCIKCGGSGRIGMYRHIDRGRCYDCDGTGQRTVRILVEKEEKNDQLFYNNPYGRTLSNPFTNRSRAPIEIVFDDDLPF